MCSVQNCSNSLVPWRNTLPYNPTARFLGLLWDKKLTWIPHINRLKAQCTKALIGLLHSVSSQTWGANQFCFLKLYRMYIRSKLDCGSLIYDSASKTALILFVEKLWESRVEPSVLPNSLVTRSYQWIDSTRTPRIPTCLSDITIK